MRRAGDGDRDADAEDDEDGERVLDLDGDRDPRRTLSTRTSGLSIPSGSSAKYSRFAISSMNPDWGIVCWRTSGPALALPAAAAGVLEPSAVTARPRLLGIVCERRTGTLLVGVGESAGHAGAALGGGPRADADADADEECSDAGEARGGPSGIDAMTGRLYAQRAAIGDSGPTGAGMGRLRQLRCPYPNLSGFSSSSSPLQHLQRAAAACEYAFGRAYDLRRHLEAVHGVVLEKEIVDMWARRVRAGLARGSSH